MAIVNDLEMYLLTALLPYTQPEGLLDSSTCCNMEVNGERTKHRCLLQGLACGVHRDHKCCTQCSCRLYFCIPLTWDLEGIGLGLCKDTDRLPLFSGSKALGVHRLSVQTVLHHIGNSHVSMSETKLGECSVQSS